MAPKFKEKFGDNWENEINKASWKRFGTLKEHVKPDYIEDWKKKGYEISYEKSPTISNPDQIIFHVSKNDMEIEITEPETGLYVLNGKSYDSFDDALNTYLKDQLPDAYILETLRRRAGI